MAKVKTESEKGVSVTGCIFQFNESGILFEFNLGDEDGLIGVVKPSNVIIDGEGNSIPESAKTVESLSKFFQTGDELKCVVFKRQGLKPFKSIEEVEEVDSEGKVVSKSSEVLVTLDYVSEKATLIRDKGKTLDNSEIGEIEEQLGKQFHDEIEILDDVTEPATDKKETPNQKRKRRRKKQKMAFKEERKMFIMAEKQMLEAENEAFKAQKENVAAEEKDEKDVAKKSPPNIFKAKGVLSQLRKPQAGGKVVTGVIKMLNGQFAGRLCNITSSCMYVYGHQLSKANLMNYIKHGDECIVQYSVHGDDGSGDSFPMIKRAWIGPETETKIAAAEDKEFAKWLVSRGIDEAKFKKWVSNVDVPHKSYFPFVADIYEAEIISILREKGGEQGMMLKILKLVKENPLALADNEKQAETTEKIEQPLPPEPKDEGDEEISMVLDCNDVDLDLMDEEVPKRSNKASESDDHIAVLLQEDFFAYGVPVKDADVRLLVRPGDIVHVQINAMNAAVKRRFRKFSEQRPDLKLTHCAYLGYIGPNRPKMADADLKYADGLESFLTARGLTLKEFKELRDGTGAASTAPLLPVGYIPPLMGNTVSNIGETALATSLVSKVMTMSGEDDVRVETLLRNNEEIQVAIKMSKILTTSLVKQMQSKMRGKINLQLNNLTRSQLNSQRLQLSAVEKALVQNPIVAQAQARAGSYLQSNLPRPMPNLPQPTSKVLELLAKSTSAIINQQRLKEIEKKAAEEAAQRAQALAKTNKKTPANRDMKKILESYKSEKATAETQMTPLDYLKTWWKKGSSHIKYGINTICFGTVSFPKDEVTNFKVTQTGKKSNKSEFYTLKELLFMMEHRKKEFVTYVRNCNVQGIRVVNKADRSAAIAYIIGDHNTPPPQQLQPDLRLTMNKRKAEEDQRKEEEKEKVQLQMQMLSNQPKVKKKSRFDISVTPVSATQPRAFQQQPVSGYGAQQVPYAGEYGALAQQQHQWQAMQAQQMLQQPSFQQLGAQQPLVQQQIVQQPSSQQQPLPDSTGQSRLDYLYQRQKEIERQSNSQERGRSFSPTGSRRSRENQVASYYEHSRSRSPRRVEDDYPVPVPIEIDRPSRSDYDPLNPTDASPPSSPQYRPDAWHRENEQRRWQEERDKLKRQMEQERKELEREKLRLLEMEREREEAERKRAEQERKFRLELEQERIRREKEEEKRRKEEELRRQEAEERRKAEEEQRIKEENEVRRRLEREKMELEAERRRLQTEKHQQLIESEKRRLEEEKRRRDEDESRFKRQRERLPRSFGKDSYGEESRRSNPPQWQLIDITDDDDDGRNAKRAPSPPRLSGFSSSLDRSAPDRSGFDRSVQDRSGFDRSAQDRSGFDRSVQDRSGFDQHRNGQHRNGRDLTDWSKNGHGLTVRNSTVQDSTAPNPTAHQTVDGDQMINAEDKTFFHQHKAHGNHLKEIPTGLGLEEITQSNGLQTLAIPFQIPSQQANSSKVLGPITRRKTQAAMVITFHTIIINITPIDLVRDVNKIVFIEYSFLVV